MTDGTLRIITAFVAIPIVVLLTYLGGWPFGLFVLVVALGAQFELYKIFEAGGLKPLLLPGLLLGVVVALRAFIEVWAPVLIVGIIITMILALYSRDDNPLSNVAVTFFGIIYPTALISFLIDMRMGQEFDARYTERFLLTISLFIIVWATDTVAYYFGRSFGKRPLFPRISPKKTWEGSLSGALGAFLVASLLKVTLLDFVPWVHILLLALIGGVVGQFGDLIESMFKRSVKVKDSGGILPGHGGFLDRFDAMIIAAPLAYLYLEHVARLLN